MAVSDNQAKNAKAGPAPYFMADGAGLRLRVAPTGARSWQFRYRAAGKENILSLGAYPAVTLAQARAKASLARAAVAGGLDPSKPVEAPISPTFKEIARQWHGTNVGRWKPHHAADVLDSLAVEVFPHIGALPADTITAPAVLAVLRAIESRPAVDTAHRVRQRISAAFTFGIAAGLCTANPAAAVGGALATVVKRHRPAVLDLGAARAMLAAVEAIPAQPVTRLALRVLALTAVRPGELRQAEWTEFEGLDGEAPLWRIPAARMKMGREHLVPLAPQTVDALTALQTLTGRGPLPFPGAWNAHKPMSDAALGSLLHRAGYHGAHVPHGWQSTFSTAMNERYPADRAVIDLMLAHLPPGAVEAAYNRATHIERRRDLAGIWAGLLMEGLPSAINLLGLARR